MSILAIDFDSVIHDPYNREPGKKMGRPIPGAVLNMKLLKEDGHVLIIHTIWATELNKRRAIEHWLHYFDIPFDMVTSLKPKADWYIDDKAIAFDSWPKLMVTLGYRDDVSH